MFDFITDIGLREELQRDYEELLNCFESSAWKAVHVLAGSILEAILVDHLIAMEIDGYNRERVVQIHLGELLEVAFKNKIISRKTLDLSGAINQYRNLIHPGRLIRLEESVDREASQVVVALVKIVAKEVAVKKKAEYGFTAEQLLTKIENDKNVVPILRHILKQTKPHEVKKLALELIPQRIVELEDEWEFYADDVAHLRSCYRELMSFASDTTRREAARAFVRVLREESGGVIETYSREIFRAVDLEYLDGDDHLMAKEYIYSKLHDTVMDGTVRLRFEGLGRFVLETEILKFIDPLARHIVGTHDHRRETAFLYLEGEAKHTPLDLDDRIAGRFKDWLRLLEQKARTDGKNELEGLVSHYELSELPF